MIHVLHRPVTSSLLLGAGIALAACSGNIGGGAPGVDYTATSGGSSGATGSSATTAGTSAGTTAGTTAGTDSSTGSIVGTTSTKVDPGMVTAPNTPFDAHTAYLSVRKVKNLLTGLAPTDADVATVTSMGAAGLQTLIGTWLTDANYANQIRGKMMFFLRNTFQQTGFTPTEDFKMQLLQNGGFDFQGMGTRAIGDDSYYRLVQNIEDSFALTAWQIVTEGRPFSETVTTQKYLMTTALKSLYLQIEMPSGQNIGARGTTAPTPIAWSVDYSGNPIAIEEVLDPNSAHYMVFSDEAPATTVANARVPTNLCRGGAIADPTTGALITQAAYTGYGRLFQRLLGYTPQYNPPNTPQGTTVCAEHASKPYFNLSDVSDWKWVTVRAQATGETYVQPFDLPTLRNATELAVKLPRMGFFTTPAFLALWNTNDSNQHRVTANQTLLGALGESFTSEATIVPLSAAGLDSAHAVDGSECLGCHKSLDPMRTFWANQFDYNDRNDFPTRGFMNTAANPRPTTMGGLLAFANVNTAGATLLDIGSLLMQVTDGADNLSRFAVSVTQKLCYFANSTACSESDPEFRRIAKSFQDSNFGFGALVKELFSSPLVTGFTATSSFPKDSVPLSISRRDHFCGAMSNRLGLADVCAMDAPLPTSTQTTTLNIATSIVGDAFSRGAESPVTPADPSLFYRAATEMLCENIATMVVDPAAGVGAAVYASTDVANGIEDMVTRVMGYPPGDPHHAQAASILQAHHDAVGTSTTTTTAGGRGGTTSTATKATTAMRSTFVLACESPTSVSFGL